MKLKQTYHGFSLVEVLIVLLLLSGGFIILLQALNTGKTMRAKSELLTIQAVLLNDKVQEIRSRKFDENTTSPWSTTLGIESGETFRDDLDDYHLFALSEYPNQTAFGCSVKVAYVQSSSGFHTAVTGPTDYKRIMIEINHKSIPALRDTFIVSSGL